MTFDLTSQFGGLPLSWWLSLPPAVCIVFLAMVARLTQGSWLAPGAAWAGFWACGTVLPLILAPRYEVSPSALWVIASFVGVIYIGSHVGLQGCCLPARPAPPRRMNRLMPVLCWMGCVAGFLMTGLTLIQYQSSWSVWLSLARLGELANAISSARYIGEANESVLIRFCLVFSYLGSLAGGHAMGGHIHGRFAWWSIAPLVAALSYAVLTTAKAGVLIATLLWLAAYVTARMRRDSRSFRLSWKVVWFGAIGGALVVVLFVAAMLLRYGFDHAEDRAFLIERLRNYSLSHVTAFSSWWDLPARSAEPVGLGRQSLFGPAAMLGLSTRQQGVYDVILNDRYQTDSNLFTLYRSLISDFTLVGGLFVMASFGLLAGRSYRNIVTGRPSPSGDVFLTAFFAVLGWSQIVNVLGYTTLLLAFGLYTLATGSLHHRWTRRSVARTRQPSAP